METDPTPMARAIGNDLTRPLADPGAGAAPPVAAATVSLRARHSQQSVILRLAPDQISVAHGLCAEADLTAMIDLRTGELSELQGPASDRDPELVSWLRGALGAPDLAWTEAAERFWTALSVRPGAPPGLRVVNLDRGEERSFGAEIGNPYEIHGSTAALLEVLTGRTPLLEAVFERGVLIRGSFPQISVLTGAGFELRYGGENEHA